MRHLLSPAALFAAIFASIAARAEPYVGMAKPWQLNFQPPASPVMHQLYDLHDKLLWLIIGISLFVLVVLGYICLRFNSRANPVPSKTTHNTKLEIIWTAIPILILIAIAIPSIRLHYYMETDVEPEMTLKVVGYQWYWHYDYPDQGGFGFDSYIKKGNDLKPGDIRMLAVDNAAVVPVGTKVRVLITGADVIHSFSVPAFGIKRDAVPGKLNETWFEAEKIGTFYGQCSQLCGVGHGFMPVVVNVVSKEDFAEWAKKKQAEAGVSAAPAEGQKTNIPTTEPVSAEHANPAPIIAKEKSMSKPGAADNSKGADKSGNQPAPAKASGDNPAAKVKDNAK